jgi:two-component system phosphate regulon sensor histidine kinase PhoR
MNFRLLVFYISAVFSLSLASVSYFYAQHWQQALLIMVFSFVISFIILTNILHHYIHTRISNIYKLIRSLKLGKDMKVVLAEHASEDPILSTEKEVRDWAIQKYSEIDQLKAQEKFRREFLSNISHEFKTPLFAIQGYIETLKDGMIEEDVEMANNFLNKASRNLDRLTYLLNDLDEISKLETGQISIHLEKFDIVELILETVDHLIDKAQRQNIEIVIDLKNNIPVYVKADRQRIQQVLINLIDNSIKYGRDGGKTKVNLYPLLDQILVEVTDNGLGIEEKNISRVFERFFRTDKSRSRDVGGSGLGLSIVKHIIEAHQQTVHARSTEGIGTTFGFTLAKSKAHH